MATSHSKIFSSFANLTRNPSTGSSIIFFSSSCRALTALLVGLCAILYLIDLHNFSPQQYFHLISLKQNFQYFVNFKNLKLSSLLFLRKMASCDVTINSCRLLQRLARHQSTTVRDCGMAKSSEPIKWQDSNTPTLTPYKAFSGALLL